jgi:hypothetical protein
MTFDLITAITFEPITMITDRESKIDYVIDSFDFAKVVIIMGTLDWGWGTDSGALEVPTIKSLKKVARYLLKNSIEAGCTGTGGLEATYVPDDGEDEEMFTLRFVAVQEDSESWCD